MSISSLLLIVFGICVAIPVGFTLGALLAVIILNTYEYITDKFNL